MEAFAEAIRETLARLERDPATPRTARAVRAPAARRIGALLVGIAAIAAAALYVRARMSSPARVSTPPAPIATAAAAPATVTAPPRAPKPPPTATAAASARTVRLRANAPNAIVYGADGHALGAAPVELRPPPSGALRLTVRAPGYRGRAVDVTAATPAELEVALERLAAPRPHKGAEGILTDYE
jgi:hypothetical protein